MRHHARVSHVDDLDEAETQYRERLRTLDEWDNDVWAGIDTEPVAAYVAAARSERIGESSVIRLIAHPGVTEAVLDTVEEQLPEDWTAAHARLEERRVRLPLERGLVEQGLTEERDQLAAVAQGSRNIHLWLLDYVGDLSREAVERLAADGSTRAVRNRAAQRLRSRPRSERDRLD